MDGVEHSAQNRRKKYGPLATGYMLANRRENVSFGLTFQSKL